jgi:hypothetical protein
MPEDAGKKRFIKDFLKDVQTGAGFVEDIRIERVVRHPGSEGEGCTARSLSEQAISNITQLLEDDLRHTFDEGYFTFRFVAALVGSGKTSLLTYLHELAKTHPNYKNLSVVVQFQLSDLLTVSGSQSFSIKLYCHLLAYTFWELLHNKNLSLSVKEVAERILNELLVESPQVVAQLKSATNLKIQFYPKFNKHVAESGVGFEEFFFYVISEVAAVEPRFTFVYLTDELDGLQKFTNEIQETRFVFKELIRRAFQEFKSNIRLLIYLVGTADHIQGFIAEDSVLESLVERSVINLNKGYKNEFETIRSKIDERIKGAYKGYENFAQAWQELKNIPLNPANTLRLFCQEYASAVLAIHEKYFKDAPEQRFEGNARDLVEAQCRHHWAIYLKKAAYKLSAVSTTTVLEGHAFDCYVELLHNDNCVARAFGEAKNYELLSGHLDTFKQWLDDVKFKASTSDATPVELAFMIAPSCPHLLQRKLDLKHIKFIKSDKIIDATPAPTTTATPAPTPTPTATPPDPTSTLTPVNINTADKASLKAAFKGAKVRDQTFDKLINRRPYVNLDVMASNLPLTATARQKLQEKLDRNEICFS